MNIIIGEQARRRIEDLEIEIEVLKKRHERLSGGFGYCEPSGESDGIHGLNIQTMNARQILQRFRELYDYLGVKRDTGPRLSELKRHARRKE